MLVERTISLARFANDPERIAREIENPGWCEARRSMSWSA
jgi:hypothetical protein